MSVWDEEPPDDGYKRKPPPHNPARAFLEEQEQRSERGRETIVNGHGAERGYDRSGKPVMDVVDPQKWGDLPVPQRDWMIEGWLLRGTVALVTGDGGMGKSLLMQQLATAAATNNDWLNIPVKPTRTLAMFCEDTEKELHIRQSFINRHYGIDYSELEAIKYVPRPGLDNILEVFDRNTDRGTKTPLFHELRENVLRHKAQLVILDTAADIYGGNENFRTQVRNFISSLRGLALEIDGGVILTAHPSVSGMASGSGISGSTAWHNSVRARAFLTKPMSADGDDTQTTGRILKFPKNNSGPASGTLNLEWADGVFRSTGTVERGGGRPLDQVDKIELHSDMLAAFKDMVEVGSKVAAAPDYRDGFVVRLRKMPEFKAYTHGQLVAAQQEMVRRKKLVMVEVGPPSKRRAYLQLPAAELPLGEPPAEPPK